MGTVIQKHLMIRLIIALVLCAVLISCTNSKAVLTMGRDKASLSRISTALSAPELESMMFLESLKTNAFIDQDALTFTLKPNQRKLFGGIRSELSVNFPYQVGERVTYTFDMKVPADFVADNKKNRWWIFAQWHDQPDPKLNETWNDMPGNSPPISLFVEEREGVFGVGVNYLNSENFWFAINKGEWNRYRFEIHWSDVDTGMGQLLFSFNDEIEKNFVGRNMLNSYQHYLKIGMYRHPKINTFNRVLFKSLIIEGQIN